MTQPEELRPMDLVTYPLEQGSARPTAAQRAARRWAAKDSPDAGGIAAAVNRATGGRAIPSLPEARTILEQMSRGGGAEAARRLDTKAKRWRAKDVAMIRDEMLKRWRKGVLRRILIDHPVSDTALPVKYRDEARGQNVFWTMEEWHDWLIEMLACAELFYVDAEMTDRVRHVAQSVPSYQVYEDRLPARVGFVVYEHPVVEVAGEMLAAGQRVEISGALWAPVPDVGGGEEGAAPGIMLVTFQDTEVLHWTQPVGFIQATKRQMEQVLTAMVEKIGPLSYHDEYPLPFGATPWGAEGVEVNNAAIAALMGTWTYMHQRITEVRPEPAPRHLVERARKRGQPAPPEVRVVTLAPRAGRRPAEVAEPGQDADASGRKYNRRFVVSGYEYWRNTWYPSRERHELQLISVESYVKGPEGAEWVPPKVKALRERR